MRTVRAALINVGLAVGGVLAAILLAEGTLRVVGYQTSYYYPRYLFLEDEGLGYRLRPGFVGHQSLGEFVVEVRINSLGLRGVERSWQPAEAHRILGLGDSFTFGTGVRASQTYLAVLEDLFRTDGRNVEVVNAGVPGYGTRQQLAYLQREGQRLRPNLVLLGFLPFNDPDDNVTPAPIVRDGFLVSPAAGSSDTAPALLYRWKAFLRTHSYTYSLVVNQLKESPSARRILFTLGLAGEVFPIEVQFYQIRPPVSVQLAWQVTFDLLRRMDAAARAMNARLVVVLIPSRAQVYPEWWARVLARYGLTEATADASLPTRTAAAYLEANGIAYVDLWPQFRRPAEAGRRLYYDLDGHWNPEGHREAAVAIHEYLVTKGLVPTGRRSEMEFLYGRRRFGLS